MTNTNQSVRGMHDILPDDSALWRWLEGELASIFDAYDYREIRTPIIEKTEVFTRAIGQATDVVEKEMYVFADRNGEALSLRPEGTAGVVRAAIQHGLLHTPGLKVWYRGPMFRHERPQRGRQRQFHQFGAEMFGYPDAQADAELIAMGERIWRRLGLDTAIRLEINSLGDAEDRRRYRQQLLDYLEPHRGNLDEDSRRRLDHNPLRIFDSKVEQTQVIMADAPRLQDALASEAREHFAAVTCMLDRLGIEYRVNPGLVRGLDYYSRTVFEWVTDQLGAQGTVCAGGRYDGLVEIQGGRPSPGLGFAMGAERLIELLRAAGVERADGAQAFLVYQVDPAVALQVAETLRDRLPELRLGFALNAGSLKSQFKRADRSGAGYAIVLGESEVAAGQCQIKDLRASEPQERVALTALPDRLAELLSASDAD